AEKECQALPTGGRCNEAGSVVVGDTDEDDATAGPDGVDRIGQCTVGPRRLEGDVEVEPAPRDLSGGEHAGSARRPRGASAVFERVGGDDRLAAGCADRLHEEKAERPAPEHADARAGAHVGEVEPVQGTEGSSTTRSPVRGPEAITPANSWPSTSGRSSTASPMPAPTNQCRS